MKSRDIMQVTMNSLTKVFANCGIVLLVAPFGAPNGARVNYVSNAEREEIIVMMKEVIARFEGRAHEAPAAKQ
jgi:hypothetical protein